MVTVASKVFEMVLVMVSSFKQTAKEASNLMARCLFGGSDGFSTPSFYWRTAREPRAHQVRRGAHWHLLTASIENEVPFDVCYRSLDIKHPTYTDLKCLTRRRAPCSLRPFAALTAPFQRGRDKQPTSCFSLASSSFSPRMYPQ